MDRATFERRFAELLRAQESTKDNRGCVKCERCERCVDCTFCVECVGTRRSSYCRQCTDCAGCTSCTGCQSCTDCQHCDGSRNCVRGAYLIRCSGCTDCTYCFGCVGLQGKDFHILNEKYDRTAYFELVTKLQKELGKSPARPNGARAGS
jgi:hypothetical protein